MRKDSALIFILSLVASAGIVGGLSYWYSLEGEPEITSAPLSQKQPTATGTVEPQQHIPQRTDTPIECTLPDGSTFWTNASACEDADLNNRISRADPVDTTRLEIAEQKRKVERQSSITKKGATKPNLRGPGRSPPPDTPAECKFAIGMAKEKERMLSAAKDPSKSTWRDSYCRWIKDARDDGCEIDRKYFYYSHLCP